MATNAYRMNSPHAVSQAGVLDTLALLKDVVLPTLGKGPLVRRRKVVWYAESRGLDDKAVRRMQQLRVKYGPGPLKLRIPFRKQAVILSALDAQAVLEASPEPFAAATREKRAALSHFEPDVALASHGSDRAERRSLNEETLETGCPVHSLSEHFAQVVSEEIDLICTSALRAGVLDWDTFFEGWYRMVRRVVLGSAARDDQELTDLLEQLRYRANFAFLRPKDRKNRDAFLARVRHYVERADAGSLAGRMAHACADADQKPHHQLPQYLFAFDPAAMATFRTLALLSVHPEIETQVRQEIDEAFDQSTPQLAITRACFLDSLRLWPTTPAILRETTVPVDWREGHLDENTQVLIFAPFFHRDDEQLDDAHTFNPRLWIDAVSRSESALVPFSHGPVVCPAAHLVPLVASLAIRRLLANLELKLHEPQRLKPKRLPGTLDNYTLSFGVKALE